MRSHAPLGALVYYVAAGCGGVQAHENTPRSRVARDLGCSPESTSVEQISPASADNGSRWQVRGCGRTAVYVCTLPVRDCWREGEIKSDATATTTR